MTSGFIKLEPRGEGEGGAFLAGGARHHPKALVLLTSLVMSLHAHAATFDTQYDITLAGLSIGKASLSGVVETGGYVLNLNAALTGIVGAVARGQGAASAKGAMMQGNALSNGFSLTLKNGSVSRTMQMGASNGTISTIVINPHLEQQNDSDRIPLQNQHKTGIIDPLGALVMPVRGGDVMDQSNCNRRLSIFDGTQRFDVVLSYAGTREVQTEQGYKGPVLVCAARYVPIAGHRPDRRVIKFMAENRAMEAWLAPVQGGKALVPVRISVKTLIGVCVIEARRYVSAGESAGE